MTIVLYKLKETGNIITMDSVVCMGLLLETSNIITTDSVVCMGLLHNSFDF